jgi:hypothetical protein
MAYPESVEYRIGTTSSGNPCVVIKTQTIDWDAKPIGVPSERAVTIQEIEQLVGFCIRCGNQQLLDAVKKPLSRPNQ